MVKLLSISNSKMALFIKRFLLFITPFLFVLTTFVCLDIFKIFWHYDNYYEGTRVGINRGFVSTMVYINQRDKYQYDSFIFGNSRSIAYYGEEWKKYLPKGSSIFHFDASVGSVIGLYDKIKYIDKQHGCLNNVLMVLDRELLGRTELTGYLFRSAPALEDYKNLRTFLQEHFEAFTTYDFIYALLDFHITGEYKDYMGDYIENKETIWRKEANECRWDIYEQEISDGIYFTKNRMKVFDNVQHPDSISLPVINEERKIYLREIAKVLKKHNTSLKIVISPLYDQIKLNNDDVSFLKKTFGNDCVYNFSGPNMWNSDFHNFYEQSHYRPRVANDILKIIYESATKK